MFKTIVVILVLGQGPVHLDDELGPYATKHECFMRGAAMLYFATTKMPVIYANVGCAEKAKEDDQDDGKDKEKGEGEKIKVGV